MGFYFWKPLLFGVLYGTPSIPVPCIHNLGTNTATFSQSASCLDTTHAFFFDVENEGQGFANTFKEAKHLPAALFLAESEA